MFKLLLQVAVTVGVSVGVGAVIGSAAYLTVSLFVAIIVLGVIVSTRGAWSNDEHAPGPVWLLYTSALAVVLGLCWAVFPLAWAWRDASAARAAVDASMDAAEAASAGRDGERGGRS